MTASGVSGTGARRRDDGGRAMRRRGPGTALLLLGLVLLWPLSGLCAAGDVRPMSKIERAAMERAAKGDFDEAIETARSGITGGRDDADFVRVVGDIQLMAGRVDEAEKSFRKALEMNPRNHEAILGLGNVRKARGDLAGAEEQYKKAVELNPYPVPAYHALGLLYEEQGRLDEAIRYYKKGIAKMGYRAGCTRQ